MIKKKKSEIILLLVLLLLLLLLSLHAKKLYTLSSCLLDRHFLLVNDIPYLKKRVLLCSILYTIIKSTIPSRVLQDSNSSLG